MHLVAAGLSFRSAPISVRERAVVPASEASALLRYLVGHCGLRGAAVLSTCNRTEFYVSCPTTELADDVCPRLAQYLDPTGDRAIGAHLFALRDAQAIRHMLRVAGGLESMVVGEAQVLGQFRDAHQVAREAGSLDTALDYVMRRALTAGKRVRTETGIGRRAGSIADVAVEIAGEIASDLDGRGVLVLGAGAMSTLAARRLSRSGARVTVVSRGGESAVSLAAELGAGAVAVTDPLAAAADIDVVISCTNSSAQVLTAADVAAVQAVRGHRPLGIIDIAVPRDVDPAAASVPGVTLVDVDAMGGRIAELQGQRLSALAEATSIIEAEVVHALTVIDERDTAGPTIAALVRQAEALRRQEVERTLARMPGVDGVTVERIQQLTRSLVGKLLHAPISHLREFADDPAVALTLRDAFALDAAPDADGEHGENSLAAS
ncbi:MAG TPA: glutamyl-tRNA reductase [Candidatus Dormibacteraeota bacterium]|jgi:glutamyl-tRNA reductase